jgi:TonB family protein
VVALVIVLLIVAARRLAARTRATLAWIALAKFAVPAALLSSLVTSITGSSPAWIQSEAIVLPAVFAATTSQAAMIVTQEPLAETAATLSPAVWLLILWAVGAIAVLATWLVRRVGAKRSVLEESREVPSDIAHSINVIAERHGFPAPRGLLVTAPCGPATLGIRNPRILLPNGLAESLTPEELESVILHELVHIRRRDNLWAFVRMLVVAALWFHPLAWLLNRWLNLETERSCDERVLELTQDPRAYAGGIMKALRHGLGIPQPNLAGITTPPIVVRLRSILDPKRRPERRGMRAIATLTALTLVALAGHAGTMDAASEASSTGTPAASATAAPVSESQSVMPNANETIRFSGTLAPGRPFNIAPQDAPNEQNERNFVIPVPKSVQAPTLPEAVVAGGLSGDITVRFIVNFQGTVVLPRVIQSTQRELERPVLNAISTWTFDPGYFEGQSDRLVATLVDTSVRIEASAQNVDPVRVNASLGEEAEISQRLEVLAEERRLMANAARERLSEARLAAEAANAQAREAMEQLAELRAATEAARPVPPQAQPSMPRAPEGPVPVPATPPLQNSQPPRPVPAGAVATGTVPPAAAAPAQPPQAPAQPAPAPQGNIYAAIGEIFDLALVDRQPIPVVQVRPEYPASMRSQNVRGEVVLRFIVDVEGTVRQPRVISSTQSEFDRAAIDAIAQWRFRPAQRQGQSVATLVELPFIFSAPTGVAASEQSRPGDSEFVEGVGLVIRIDLLDQLPVPLVQARPVYPAAMRKSGVRGEVVTRFILDSRGAVRNARVISSSQPEFDQAALDSISKWRFRPGRKDGEPVATWVEVPIIFAIR